MHVPIYTHWLYTCMLTVPCVPCLQYYAFVEEKQKVHCLNTLFSKVGAPTARGCLLCCAWPAGQV